MIIANMREKRKSYFHRGNSPKNYFFVVCDFGGHGIVYFGPGAPPASLRAEVIGLGEDVDLLVPFLFVAIVTPPY